VEQKGLGSRLEKNSWNPSGGVYLSSPKIRPLVSRGEKEKDLLVKRGKAERGCGVGGWQGEIKGSRSICPDFESRGRREERENYRNTKNEKMVGVVLGDEKEERNRARS